MGDLFVIRVAGNIVAPSLIGSVELAAENFGARLVVVLGHTGCSAVAATIDVLQSRESRKSRNINSIINTIRPSVEGLVAESRNKDREQLMHVAVRANVLSTVDGLRHGSETLERLIDENGLMVVGAEYSLETGIVEYLHGIPGLDDEFTV